jgi:hypothetical protein
MALLNDMGELVRQKLSTGCPRQRLEVRMDDDLLADRVRLGVDRLGRTSVDVQTHSLERFAEPRLHRTAELIVQWTTAATTDHVEHR